MKPSLLILSDLFGKENDDWIQYYIKTLNPYFTITYYDTRKLGKLGKLENIKASEPELHQQFIEYGIEQASNNLIKNHETVVNILAFSIGGTIAWNAALNGLKTNKMFLISATRLRYEKTIPNCNIHLIYGNNDTYKPNNNWLKNSDNSYELIKNGNHELYKSIKIAHRICSQLTS